MILAMLTLVAWAAASVGAPRPETRIAAVGFGYSIAHPAGWHAEIWRETRQIILCTQRGRCTSKRGGYPLPGAAVMYIVPIESLSTRSLPESVEAWVTQSHEDPDRHSVTVSLQTWSGRNRHGIHTTGVRELHPIVRIRQDIIYLQESHRFAKIVLESGEGDPKYNQYLKAALAVTASLEFELSN